MLERVLEPEVMDSEAEARDYDAMDHAQVNRVFVADLLARLDEHKIDSPTVLDLGTGTAQIPIELCRQRQDVRVVAIDLARHMIDLAERNIAAAGLSDRIQARLGDAKTLSLPDAAFETVMSNSIVHHIPDPRGVIAEIVRVTRPGGVIFVRDLLRPESDAAVRRLVQLYAGDANDHQRQMFDDSLRAALTLDEVRALVTPFGFDASTVRQTSDRHWTWSACKPLPALTLAIST